MHYPFLIFDADHTLFDFDQAQDCALKSTIVALHGNFDADYYEVYNEVNRRLWLAFERGEITQQDIKVHRFEHFLERTGLPLDPFEANTVYLYHLSVARFLLEGAVEVVQGLALDRKLLFDVHEA